MNIYVDIDETICHTTDMDYPNSTPIHKNITKINKLFEEGNHITYWTARGSITKKKWFELTREQLLKWGCKYHVLNVGNKPAYDLLICDKTKRIEEI